MAELQITAETVAELIGTMEGENIDPWTLEGMPDQLAILRRLETIMDLWMIARNDTGGDAELAAAEALDKYLEEWHA